MKKHHHTYNNRHMDPNLPPATPTPQPQPGQTFKPSLLLIAVVVLVLTLTALVGYYMIQKKAPTPPETSSGSGRELVFARRLLPPVLAAEITSQNGPFTCPAPSPFCKNGAYKESSLSGKLAQDTPLRASFDGILTGSSALHPIENGKGEEFNLAILTNPNRGLEAMYYFKGEIGPEKEVKEGEIIATISGQPINFMGGNSFVFTLIQATEKGGLQKLLSGADFK